MSTETPPIGGRRLRRKKPGNLIRFRQEAQQVWEEQEVQWEKERKARGQLMQEVEPLEIPVRKFPVGGGGLTADLCCGKVLAGRRQQLAAKMQTNCQAREESQRRREELLQELEAEENLRRQEKEKRESRRTAWLREVDAQVGPPGRNLRNAAENRENSTPFPS